MIRKIKTYGLALFAIIGAVVIVAAIVRGMAIGSVAGELKSIFKFSPEA